MSGDAGTGDAAGDNTSGDSAPVACPQCPDGCSSTGLCREAQPSNVGSGVDVNLAQVDLVIDRLAPAIPQ